MKILNTALFLLFPTVCGICGKISKKAICENCYKTMKEKIKANIDDYSQDKSKYFEEHAYLFFYEDMIREKILQYKFHEKSYLAEMFSEFFVKNEKISGFLKKYDIIIPVPISKKRLHQRGYNQSALIVRNISKNSNILYQNILIKYRDNLPQSTLNKEKRMQNVKNVYKLQNMPTIRKKKILLFDDIYTTGSTTNECARILKQARSRKSRSFDNCKGQISLKKLQRKGKVNGRFN